jgi:hypothetical protein
VGDWLPFFGGEGGWEEGIYSIIRVKQVYWKLSAYKQRPFLADYFFVLNSSTPVVFPLGKETL